MKKIDIRNLANIGVPDIDVYKTNPLKNNYKLKLRIGVFFDGTGNNRFNSDSVYYGYVNQFPLDEANLPEKELKKTANGKVTKNFVPESGSSYWNNYSNISLLHDLYQEKTIRNNTNREISMQFRQYIQGIGTLDGEQDDLLGSGLAESDRGVVERVKQACKAIVDQIVGRLGKTVSLENIEIEEIKFDVFGFSRGAAAARHFCNEVLKRKLVSEKASPSINNLNNKNQSDTNLIPSAEDLQMKEKDFTLKQNIDATLNPTNTGSFMEHLFRDNLKQEYPVNKVTIEFLGIFDTVISQMLEKNNIIDAAKTIEDNKSIAKIFSKPIILGSQAIIPTIDPISSTLKLLTPLAGEIIVDKLLKINKKVADLPKINPNLNNKSIKKVFHIMAMSDWRKNFPVTPVNDAQNVRQIWMLGAHSDIGGGYSDFLSESKNLHFMDISPSISPEQKSEAEQERINLRNWYINNYYCKDFEITWEEYHHLLITDKSSLITKTRIILMPKNFMGDQLIKTENKIEYKLLSYHYTLNSTRTQISNKLSVVSLKVMQHMATQYGNVPFLNYEQVNPPVKYPFEYDLPKELTNYCDSMIKIAETGWKKDKNGKIIINKELFSVYNDKERIYKIDDEIYKLINGKYVHLSANFNSRVSKKELEDILEKYIKKGLSEKLNHLKMLYANEPQFNENKNEKQQPYTRLTYYPYLSNRDKVNSN